MTDSTAGEEAHAHHRGPTRPFAPRHICRLQLSFSAGQGTVSSSLTLHGRPVTCQPADVARHGGANPCPGGTRRVLTNAMNLPADDVVLALVVAETVGRILSTAQGCIAPLPTSQRCQLACLLGHALLTTCAVSPLTVVNHVNLPLPPSFLSTALHGAGPRRNSIHHRQRVWQPAATGLVLGRGPLERSWFVAQAAWQGCENKPLQCPAESRSNTVEV
ncbi:hypothetical protein Purlil1_8359 [Purpureocillium lilacinum]|uniref:Uncharacterized protein n=1 Tax=Purpureocillium lilacinum TaxID=33203 RepID=A0ABR0BT85_PURLI|nr:hypothetical protein Purlil1_8359 [Purpureocillium lilacinum]